ncbi:uncharacterized protein LOC129618939 [Condylostylus longicornis]|uniref:uncharacterized protein LOC129618939 n=1 Tax=Condylostylus longicornis TaxID=2530218 RepID=UPI00244E03AA|nr:uncharacterized protein LOC129618939 [Condylostylus longicornis]
MASTSGIVMSTKDHTSIQIGGRRKSHKKIENRRSKSNIRNRPKIAHISTIEEVTSPPSTSEYHIVDLSKEQTNEEKSNVDRIEEVEDTKSEKRNKWCPCPASIRNYFQRFWSKMSGAEHSEEEGDGNKYDYYDYLAKKGYR